jgi:hypothetical protein
MLTESVRFAAEQLAAGSQCRGVQTEFGDTAIEHGCRQDYLAVGIGQFREEPQQPAILGQPQRQLLGNGHRLDRQTTPT